MTIGYSRPLALWTVTISTLAPIGSPTGESPSARLLPSSSCRNLTNARSVAGAAAS